MKIHFLGANRQVTGSRYCLEAGGQQVMIDCGMFQERQFVSRNWEVNPIPPKQLDALVLTHAHLDHCGLIPRLVSNGFGGMIYSTRPTVDLAEVIMRDSAKIQEEDAKYNEVTAALSSRLEEIHEQLENALEPIDSPEFGRKTKLEMRTFFRETLQSAVKRCSHTAQGNPGIK